MPSSNTEIKIFRGDGPTYTFNLQRDGSAIDLTGSTCKFTVRITDQDGAQQFQYTGTEGGASAGIAFPAPASGQLTVEFDETDTDGLDESNTYVWDLEVALSGGDTISYPRDAAGDPVRGTLVIVDDITYV